MNRNQKILKYITKEMVGIEVAPYHNPLAPKSQGFNSIVLDIYTREELQSRAKSDMDFNLKDKIDFIEEVDLVANALDIKSAVDEKYPSTPIEYILSSHNFEHLPDPITFMRSAADTLINGGILSMAIPNKRDTFDSSRSLSNTAGFLKAYLTKQIKPNPFDIFDFFSNFKNTSTTPHLYTNDITTCYEKLLKAVDQEEVQPYVDVHVWVFTMESFLAIISDLLILNLIPLNLIDFETNGFEFYVHFKNIGYEAVKDQHKNYIENRIGLSSFAYKS
jgi:SAM-dependent methyltransferase